MKKMLSALLLAAATSTILHAQQAPQQGVITYDLAIQLRKQVAKKNPAIAAMLPKQTHVTIEVPFSNGIFAIIMRQDKSSAGNVQIQSGSGNEKRIVDLKAHRERKECMPKDHSYYTETATLPATVITYINGARQIAGYSCNQAKVTTADKKQYTVWYTTALPYAYNPEGLDFAGLKGAVLEYGNDEQLCTALSIKPNGFTTASITANPAARKVTEEQMKDLQEDAASDFAKTTQPANSSQPQNTKHFRIRL